MPKAASEKSYSYKGDGQAAPAGPPPPQKADFIPELGFLQLRDDPICSSADPDCGQPIPKSHPVNYFVANLGDDEEMAYTKENIRNAEWRIGHRLYDGWAPSDPPPKDYKVPNFGVDEDIANISQIISDQEKIHGKWTPVMDDNGVWIVPKAASANSYRYSSDLEGTPAPAAPTPVAELPADFIPELGFVQVNSDPICDSANPEC